ncbi:hypothetical protein P6F26_18600 [Roseibacterium sp. SDUM158017]|uniref:calcium-binding protein n=1 Tax=Roseicyclus salinarum TaxID=3036773 RepID=UPI002414E475|nr:hypothetical protein [Roseibacterium sp. SDUM158017]MDG4650458.1 hypothetical protein [Roseibacterium sp. SDUM158017]
MGTAVGGMLSGFESGRDTSGDDTPPDDDRIPDDGMAEARELPETGLAQLLFGETHVDGKAWESGEAWEHDPAGGWAADAGDAPATPDMAAAPAPADAYQVIETAAFGDGPDLPFVSDFDAETDRLMLDFDGTEDEAPVITVDLSSCPGDAVVRANSVPITLVRGAATLTPDHVDVFMSGTPAPPDATADPAPDPLSPRDMLLDGGTQGDALAARAAMQEQFAGNTRDALTGGIGGEAISASKAGDALFGGEGDDALRGRGGHDELHGEDGDDTLRGGGRADFLDGGDGDDRIYGGRGGDFAFGGAGDDSIRGGAGDDGLQGGPGADTLHGGAGDDVIDGTFAHGTLGFGALDRDAGDLIDGGGGDDTILIGAGDTVGGGTGADSFLTGVYAAADDDAALVTDFDPGEDRIEVLYDPEETALPIVAVVDFADGSGASIVVNGETILRVTGPKASTRL